MSLGSMRYRGKYDVLRHAVEQPMDLRYKIIPLTRGMNTVVDAKNFKTLNQWRWFPQKSKRGHTYYAVRKEILSFGKSKKIYMHRQIMGNAVNRYDHKNGDGLDNREENLRACNQSQNGANRPKQNRKTGYKGVYPYRARFQAKACIQRQQFYLGTFDTEAEAARAYDHFVVKQFQEFAYTNFPRSEYRLEVASCPSAQ